MWSGAPGEVRGDGQCYGNTGTAGFYGFDNCNSGDSQGITVYYGPSGPEQCPSLKAQLYAKRRSRSRPSKASNKKIQWPPSQLASLASPSTLSPIRMPPPSPT